MTDGAATMAEVIGFVLEQADESDLDRITDAVKKRRGVLRDKAAADVKEGKQVTLYGLRPAYLNGLTGTVKSIKPGRTRKVVVTLDRRSTSVLAYSSADYHSLHGQDSHDLTGIPITCCQVSPSGN